MFASVSVQPPDAIFGLLEAFAADSNPQKINLSVGVYKDAQGRTPILNVVREAEKRLLTDETSKAYRPIAGDPIYGELVRKLLFGADAALVSDGRAQTAHCPGGTGALRVVGDYLAKNHPNSRIWVSDPTWANHHGIFGSAGLQTLKYSYFDPATHGLNFEAMMKSLEEVQAEDVVLLHGCCHNPTGVDPSLDQWKAIGAALTQRGAVPLLDFAYQGFAEGVRPDAAGLNALLEVTPNLFICSSFSKNFGLYNERTGALTVVTSKPQETQAVFSHVKHCIRTNYSNPPAHGASIVRTVLSDASLNQQWEDEVAAMRKRIHDMRALLVKGLADAGVDQDFSYIQKQRGMFSFSGLSKEKVETLRTQHSVYMVGSGRINVAGVTESNVTRLCEAIRSVL